MTSQKSASSAESAQYGLSLLAGLAQLRDDEVLTDVTLVVDGHKLRPCHRSVLSATCPYFRAMFSNDMTESQQNEIELQGFTFESIDVLVDYIYSGEGKINEENAQDVLLASGILNVTGLYEEAKEYIINRLTSSNCLGAYSFAKSIMCIGLEREAFLLVTKYARDVLKSEDFLQSTKDVVVDVLASDDLMVDREELIYEGALNWVAHDLANRTMNMNEIFSYIRMTLLEPEFLEKCLIEEPILQEFSGIQEQAAAAKRYLYGRNDSLAPLSVQTKSDTSAGEEEAGDEESEAVTEEDIFFELPHYYVTVADTRVRLPLNTHPRAGMRASELLLFTTGRRTRLYDPRTCLSYGESASCGDDDNDEDDVDSSTVDDDVTMPELKNGELFATAEGSVFLLGGLELVARGAGEEPLLLCKFWQLDRTGLCWLPRAPLAEPRCMAAIGEMNGKVYVMGGKSVQENRCLGSVQIFNPETNSWEEGPEMIRAVYGHSCASLKSGKIFVIGGKSQNREIVADVYCLNGDTHNWHIMSSLLSPRFLAGVTVSPSVTGEDEDIFVLGGIGRIGLLSTMETMKGARLSSKWKYRQNFPERRCAQTLAFFKDKLCAYGGHVTSRMQSGRYESCARFDFYEFDPIGGPEGMGKWTCAIDKVKGVVSSLYSACIKVKLDLCKIGPEY